MEVHRMRRQRQRRRQVDGDVIRLDRPELGVVVIRGGRRLHGGIGGGERMGGGRGGGGGGGGRGRRRRRAVVRRRARRWTRRTPGRVRKRQRESIGSQCGSLSKVGTSG